MFSRVITSLLAAILIINSLVSGQEESTSSAKGASLTCLTPGNGSVFTSGQPMTITWDFNQIDPTAELVISLYNNDPNVMPFSQNPIDLTGSVKTGVRSFTVQSVSTQVQSSTSFYIRVWGKVANYECKTHLFAINNPNPPPLSLVLHQPVEGAKISRCASLTLTWTLPLENARPASVFVRLYSTASKTPVYIYPQVVKTDSGIVSLTIPQTAPAGSNYFLTFYSNYEPNSLVPGYGEKYGGNTKLFSIVDGTEGCNNNNGGSNGGNGGSSNNGGGSSGSGSTTTTTSGSNSLIPAFTMTFIVALVLGRFLL